VSRLLVMLNRLKAEVRPDWLTSSQSMALAEIDRLWRFPERVNLCGPPGTGKTLLGWAVARALGAVVFASPRVYNARAPHGQLRAVIDNAPDEPIALRRMLAELQLNDTRTALLITAQPNRMGLPTVALSSPTVSDVDTVYRNLSLLDYYALTPLCAENLWDVIAQTL